MLIIIDVYKRQLYLTAEGTIDTKVLKALKSKASLAKTLVDDYRNGFNPFM